MDGKKHLPVQFNERIHATAIDYGFVFTVNLIFIFFEYNLTVELIIVFIVWYVFNLLPSFFKSGITLGKLRTQTVIVNLDYSTVSVKKMHLRNLFVLFAILFSLGMYVFVSFYLLSNRIDKRSIHDRIFGTRVVYKNPYLK